MKLQARMKVNVEKAVDTGKGDGWKIGFGASLRFEEILVQSLSGRKGGRRCCMLFTFPEMVLRGGFGGVGPHPDDKRATHMYQISGRPQQIDGRSMWLFLAKNSLCRTNATGQVMSGTETRTCFSPRMMKQLDSVASRSVVLPQPASPVARMTLKIVPLERAPKNM